METTDGQAEAAHKAALRLSRSLIMLDPNYALIALIELSHELRGGYRRSILHGLSYIVDRPQRPRLILKQTALPRAGMRQFKREKDLLST
jgi:hypothetical protein